MISRENAVKTLKTLFGRILMSQETEEQIRNIITCINAERDCLHVWDGDDEEVAELYSTVRATDEYNNAHRELCDKLYAKYKFEPSEFEKGVRDGK